MGGFWMWVLMILAVQASALPLLSSARPLRYSALIPNRGGRVTKSAMLRNLQLQEASSDHLDLIQSNIKRNDDPKFSLEDYISPLIHLLHQGHPKLSHPQLSMVPFTIPISQSHLHQIIQTMNHLQAPPVRPITKDLA